METPGGRFWRWMGLLGVAALLLRAGNIAYLLHCSGRDGIAYYEGPDTLSNLRNAEALFRPEPLAPIFRERILYPFLLAAVQRLGGRPHHLLWLTPPLEIPATLAMAWLAWTLTRRKTIAALSALLYVLNPNAFQLSATLMPDWFNGQIMLIASAALLDWARTGRRLSAAGAAALVPVSQMIRPTLFLLIGPLVVLLWRGFWSRGKRRWNLLLCAAALVYPAVNFTVNWRLYGVPTLLLSSGYQLHHCYVSYVRALLRNAEQPGSISQMYFEEKHRTILKDPREVLTDPYGHRPIAPDFARHYGELVADSKAFLRAHWPQWFRAGWQGLYRQLFYLPRLSPDPRFSHLYRIPPGWLNRLHRPMLFFAFCGAALLFRRLPWNVILFYAGCTAIIVMAVTASWYDSVRVRLLVDLLFTPVLAVGLCSAPAWLCGIAWVLGGYLPARFFRLPAAYPGIVALVLLAGYALYLWRRPAAAAGAVRSEEPPPSGPIPSDENRCGA